MSLHHSYLIVLGALFVAVFAIMIHSLAAHRRATGETATRFLGPTGTVQWLWAMVPIAILIGVDCALIDAPDRPPTARPAIARAAAPAAVAETPTR
ncbi:MAG: cytochrome c oxidase, subunit [Proteobacteria bacterium]|nr:cytochrome c oxidase, subunit [Pseudomonadota bacterium]